MRQIHMPGYEPDELKNQFLVIAGLQDNMDLSMLSRMGEIKYTSKCNVIILIAETDEKVDALYSNLEKQLETTHAGDHYKIIKMTKSILLDMYEAADVISWFSQLYAKQVSDDLDF